VSEHGVLVVSGFELAPRPWYPHSSWPPQDGCAASRVGADWSSRSSGLWTKDGRLVLLL